MKNNELKPQLNNTNNLPEVVGQDITKKIINTVMEEEWSHHTTSGEVKSPWKKASMRTGEEFDAIPWKQRQQEMKEDRLYHEMYLISWW